jgi:hypothetical protein
MSPIRAPPDIVDLDIEDAVDLDIEDAVDLDIEDAPDVVCGVYCISVNDPPTRSI